MGHKTYTWWIQDHQDIQVSEDGLNKVFTINARSTSMGAYTTFRIKFIEKGIIKVKRYDYSRSGRHWREALLVSPDASGIVHLIDVSNSGRHYCRIIYINSGKVSAIESGLLGCVVHGPHARRD